MRRVVLFVMVLVPLLGLGKAKAGPILWIDDSAGNIGTVDVATGNVHVIGNAGVILTDIGFDPNGNLYGVSFTNLYRINTSTGAAILVGPTGLTGANALVFSTSGTLYTAAFNTTDLYTLNPTTGASTNLGNIGFESAGDLAFNGGSLYLSATNNDLIRISLSPVGGTNVGPTGFSNVFGLATGDNGVLYGAAGTDIFSVNTTTGHGTLVVNYAGHGLSSANGTAFFKEAGAAATPEPASLTLLGIGAVCSLGYGWRRRRQCA